MLFVLEFVHVSSVAFVFVCVRSFSKQPPRPSTQTSAFILDWDYKLEGEESHIHTHTEEERERVCARMIDLIFSFSLVDGWMDWRFFCCACVPYHFIYRREEDEDEEGKRSEGKGNEEKKRW